MNVELRDRFVEFARLKLAADGSDSYIMEAVELARVSDDPYWYAGVFTTFYTPPSQEVFRDNWTRRDVLTRPDEVLAWVTEHWRGLPISGARRTNGMGPRKLVETLVGYARWLEAGGISTLAGGTFDSVHKQFLAGIPNHGRYTGLKLYEMLRRLGADLPVVTDIRPSGGRTPRRSLNLIYGHDHHHDTRDLLEEADALADGLRRMVPTTWFNVEMLLCNFQKAVKGSFYPGHALDRELTRTAQARAVFGPLAGRRLMELRPRLFPSVCLGELGGWTGGRKELERCLPEHGYLWSDILYDFSATRDLAAPVRRDLAVTSLRGYGEELS